MSEDYETDELKEIWDALTPEQKEFFKKLSEKNEENLRYIG